jgi:hypothetical protein
MSLNPYDVKLLNLCCLVLLHCNAEPAFVKADFLIEALLDGTLYLTLANLLNLLSWANIALAVGRGVRAEVIKALHSSASHHLDGELLSELLGAKPVCFLR